jgi:hypothetical protein
MSTEKYVRSVWAKQACERLAEHSMLYRYTMYPLDLLLANVYLWWYK